MAEHVRRIAAQSGAGRNSCPLVDRSVWRDVTAKGHFAQSMVDPSGTFAFLTIIAHSQVGAATNPNITHPYSAAQKDAKVRPRSGRKRGKHRIRHSASYIGNGRLDDSVSQHLLPPQHGGDISPPSFFHSHAGTRRSADRAKTRTRGAFQ